MPAAGRHLLGEYGTNSAGADDGCDEAWPWSGRAGVTRPRRAKGPPMRQGGLRCWGPQKPSSVSGSSSWSRPTDLQALALRRIEHARSEISSWVVVVVEELAQPR